MILMPEKKRSFYSIQFIFSTSTRLCNLHHDLIPEHSYHVKKRPPHTPKPRSCHSPQPLLPSPWHSRIYFLSQYNLPLLDISYKWNDMTCDLLVSYKFISFLLILKNKTSLPPNPRCHGPQAPSLLEKLALPPRQPPPSPEHLQLCL